MRRLMPLLLLAGLILAPVANARHVITGVSGGQSLNPYAAQTASHPAVFGFFTRFFKHNEYVFKDIARSDTTPMLHIGTNEGYGTRERITPLGIAQGKGDKYLVRLNKRLDEYGKLAYIRLMAEMNQTNNAYAGFDRSGASRGPSHSPTAFKAAWRRTTLILRGGPVADINRSLKKLKLPAVRGVGAGSDLPQPDVEMLWVPQTRGTPDIAANLPRAYWPGGAYVDWVGTDFYSKFPNFGDLQTFYSQFASKPFVFAEWALWDSGDDVAFVKRFFAWIHSHSRVKMALYNQGGIPTAPFRLNKYPRGAAEIKAQLKHLEM